MATNGGVNPAVIAFIAHQSFVQAVAHAVEPLKFEIARCPRPCEQRRDGQRVVRRERGIDVTCLKHVARAGKV